MGIDSNRLNFPFLLNPKAMEIFLAPETWIALLTLTFLEIVLGIDNIIFISIVSNKLKPEVRAKGRIIGLSMALVIRILLLISITWIIGFTKPLFSIFSFEVTGRDLILLVGGLFLIAKSTAEIHHKLEGKSAEESTKTSASFGYVIFQIIMIDFIFSFDSILTAIGLTRHVIIMIVAVVISMAIMMVAAGRISTYINKHPTLEMLALSFLILIGFMLSIEAFHYHVPKGYIYFAVAFSLLVEFLNMKLRTKISPVKLRKRID